MLQLKQCGNVPDTFLEQQGKLMVRSKNALFAWFVLLLSMTFVLGDTFVTQMNYSSSAFAQVQDGDDDDDDDDDDDEDEEEDDLGLGGNQAGVRIDATGTLSLVKKTDKTQALWRARQKQAVAKLNPQLARKSKLRKVSLTRLEKAAEQHLRDGNALPVEMRYLAGLTSIDYVFVYPETGDVVVAGPAEGVTVDDLGRARGKDSGRAVLELQDLVVALRAFGPKHKPTQLISVSIDPTQEGLARMQKFLNNIGRNITGTRSQTIQIVRGLRKSLGKQVVTFDGISPKTHFAQVLAEADYRMKLIGIGLEVPPVDITTYVDKAKAGSRSGLARWFFVPNYDSVRVSKDGLAVKLEGDGVKLVGESEVVLADGRRAETGNIDRASEVFTRSFTKMYPKLARRSPVFAQLRNLIDMTIVAAAIQQNDYFGQANWDMSFFDDEQRFPIEVFEAPKRVATAVNAIWKGSHLMTPVGGGVAIQPLKALDKEHVTTDDGAVADTRESVAITELPDSQWWWD